MSNNDGEFWRDLYFISEFNKDEPDRKQKRRFNKDERFLFWFIGYWIFVAIISHLS